LLSFLARKCNKNPTEKEGKWKNFMSGCGTL
jgi:hypothetical protein